MPMMDQRSCTPFCRATNTAGGWSRPGTQWVCARHASDDTVLEGAFVPDRYIARILPAGAADNFIVAMFVWALLGFGNIYYGVAQRAMDRDVSGQ